MLVESELCAAACRRCPVKNFAAAAAGNDASRLTTFKIRASLADDSYKFVGLYAARNVKARWRPLLVVRSTYPLFLVEKFLTFSFQWILRKGIKPVIFVFTIHLHQCLTILTFIVCIYFFFLQITTLCYLGVSPNRSFPSLKTRPKFLKFKQQFQICFRYIV